MTRFFVGWGTAVLCAVLASGCAQEEGFEVSGQVLSARGPVPAAVVTLGAGILTRTDETGRFTLSRVKPGAHTLHLRFEEDGAAVEDQRDVNVSGDVQLETLTLPVPVELTAQEGARTVEDTKVVLQWSRAFARGFREYKVYRHTTSGLDESTGTLIHVTTDREDTRFESPEAPGMKYFYRVFVMNDLGRLGGSNIASFTPQAYVPPAALSLGQPVSAHVYRSTPHGFFLDATAPAYRVEHSGDIELRVMDASRQELYVEQPRAIMMSGHPLLFLSRRAERLNFQVDLLDLYGLTRAPYTLKVSEQSLAAQGTLLPGTPLSTELSAGAVRVLQFDAVAGTHYRFTTESSARGAPSSNEVLTFASVFGADVAAPYVWDQQVGLKDSPTSTEFTATRTERLTITVVAAYWWDPTTVTATVDVLP
ncbi:carboxypeptidase-like regulatory domain-containing protein [Corallococcus sp. EGB]|uniref:carboxypeptidase-like regulatory domain-containing protein n=1 Tax=Corallococcus sp. EGB TaxID=1521117 RepID=UPI001CC05050|nr:carboxypeptidase-like regulatory domain-containing protein [Corallococcus sp. EGB]